MSDGRLSNIIHWKKKLHNGLDCAYLAQQLIAGVGVHRAVEVLPVRQGQQQERSYPGRSLVGGGDRVGCGADRGAGGRAEESLRVPRIGAQPRAFSRRLVVRVQALVGDSADAGSHRAAALQVHPEGPIHHLGQN